MSKTALLRCCLSLAAGLAAGAALAGTTGSAASGTGELVAMALAEAQAARESGDDAALSRAIGVVERAGAHPLDGWAGPDPVPEWHRRAPSTSAPLRGSPLGPGYRLGQVPAGQSESFEQVFLSGRKASVSVATRDGKPVSLRVTDHDSRLVCQSGPGTCNWVPLFTQRYRIEVRNGGLQKANYYLVVD